MEKLRVVDGRVRCPDHLSPVDVERCLGCPALRRILDSAGGRVICCVTTRARWEATEVTPS